VVIAEVVEDAPEGCRLIDLATLRATGPLAVWPEGDGVRIVTTRRAERLWSGPARAYALPDLGPVTEKLASGQ
jgi:competence protein ComEC